MEVILMENIENLGEVGDKVNVKSGFARNFLVPHGKAKVATASNLAEFEARRAELEKAASEALASAIARKQATEALGVMGVEGDARTTSRPQWAVGAACSGLPLSLSTIAHWIGRTH